MCVYACVIDGKYRFFSDTIHAVKKPRRTTGPVTPRNPWESLICISVPADDDVPHRHRPSPPARPSLTSPFIIITRLFITLCKYNANGYHYNTSSSLLPSKRHIDGGGDTQWRFWHDIKNNNNKIRYVLIPRRRRRYFPTDDRLKWKLIFRIRCRCISCSYSTRTFINRWLYTKHIIAWYYVTNNNITHTTTPKPPPLPLGHVLTTFSSFVCHEYTKKQTECVIHPLSRPPWRACHDRFTNDSLLIFNISNFVW